MIEVKGYGGQVSFDGNAVTVTRKGFIARSTIGKGVKRIPVSQITAVQFKAAGPLVNGYIQFTLPGGVEKRSRFGSQTTDAARDENSVLFTRVQQGSFEELRHAVEAAIDNFHGGRAFAARAAAPAAPVQEDVVSRLAKLDGLLEAGVITEDEHAKQRTVVLSSI